MRGAGSFFMPFMSNSLETLTLNTENGFFEGSLKLPDLDPGSYNLQVKDGDKVISSTYFSVENYVNPTNLKYQVTKMLCLQAKKLSLK